MRPTEQPHGPIGILELGSLLNQSELLLGTTLCKRGLIFVAEGPWGASGQTDRLGKGDILSRIASMTHSIFIRMQQPAPLAAEVETTVTFALTLVRSL